MQLSEQVSARGREYAMRTSCAIIAIVIAIIITIVARFACPKGGLLDKIISLSLLTVLCFTLPTGAVLGEHTDGQV
jgi:hypothetical protein